MTYRHYFEKYHFNEKTNELEINRDTRLSVKVTLRENKTYREQFISLMIQTVIYLVIVLAVGLVIALGDRAVSGIVFSSIVGSLTVVAGLFWAFNDYTPKDKVELSNLFNDNEEYIKLQEHNHRELERMQEWRNNHPFEEKVRKAMQSKNSNDIAEVIRIILEKDTI